MNHSPSRAAQLDGLAIGVMLVLCASWGFQQIVIKLALPELPPVAQAAIRSVISSVLVSAYAVLRGRDLGLKDGTLAPGLACGALFAVEFLCLFVALSLTDAARAVMMLYTAPFVVAVGGRVLPNPEPITPDRWAGIGIAFLGLAVLLGPSLAVSAATLLGDLLALVAGILWGLTTLIVKATPLRQAEPVKVLLYQLVVSAVALTLASWLMGETFGWPTRWQTWLAVAYQAVWISSVTFTVWFALVARYPPARLSVLTFLSPLFGVAFGVMILGEPLTLSLAGAVVLVAGGIWLVNRPA